MSNMMVSTAESSQCRLTDTNSVIPEIVVSPPSKTTDCSKAPWLDTSYVHFSEHLRQLWLPHNSESTELTPPPRRRVLTKSEIQSALTTGAIQGILRWNAIDTEFFGKVTRVLPAEVLLDSDMETKTLKKLLKDRGLLDKRGRLVENPQQESPAVGSKSTTKTCRR